MSDGMSDSRAEERLDRDVWAAAFDVAENGVVLARAIMRARMGHRGWGTARWSVIQIVNEALGRTGFELVDRKPDKSFENYPDAYERKETWREKELKRKLEDMEAEMAKLRRELEDDAKRVSS